MNYEPRGKVKLLIDAMRSSPIEVWPSADCAAVMQTLPANVSAAVASALANEALYHQKRNNRVSYSLRPFPDRAELLETSDFEASLWLNGDLHIYNGIACDDGSIQIKSRDVQRLRRMLGGT